MEDSRTLHLLQCEQVFFNAGGYGRRFRSRWRPTLIFRDSPVCINFQSNAPVQPCQHCALFQFVPDQKRTSRMPCHEIPLNSKGETIAWLYKSGTQEQLDDAVRSWLKSTIHTLEREEKDHAGA